MSSDERLPMLASRDAAVVGIPRHSEEAKQQTAGNRICSRRDLLFGGLVVLHVAVGVGFFAIQRRWGFVDCVYFTVLTLTTIGYGDMAPGTNAEKIFTTFYVLISFCLLGYMLGQVARYVARREEAQFRMQLQQARNGGQVASAEMSVLGRVALAAHGMLFFLAVGTLFYSLVEGWTSIDALYFSAVSLTTVGYGDLQIKSEGSRIFSIFYLLLGTMMTAFFLGTIAQLTLQSQPRSRLLDMLYDHETNQQVWQGKSDQSGQVPVVTEADYMTYMLVNSGQVECETIEEIKYRYQQLHRQGVATQLANQYSCQN